VIPTNPCLVDDGVGVLCLSHEAFIPASLVWRPSRTLIRNSTIDSITGSIDVRILEFFPEFDGPCTSCLDLILPKSHGGLVLPITINMHQLFKIGSGWFGSDMGRTSRLYVESSEDGHVRGFCGVYRNFPLVKFTIDATQDKCVALVGEPSQPIWHHAAGRGLPFWMLFDGVRGRLCYIDVKGDDDVFVVVADIK
jgi:hypothetical protein